MSRQQDAGKTCPLCAEPMRLERRIVVDHVPGMKHSIQRTLFEWICSNCDHYEDADEREADASG